MEPIELKWKGPFKFSEINKIPNNLGIYIHSITTNIERIWYVGEGSLMDCQSRHLKNLSKKNLSTINFNKIRNNDFYDYCTKDRFLDSPEINIEGHFSPDYWKGEIGTEKFKNNLDDLKRNTNIYIATIQNNYFLEFTQMLKKCMLLSIEANIQFYLIKEFSLDVYANYEYKIGLCRNNRKYIDNSIEIKNDFENVNIIHKKCLNDHLNRNSNGYLSLSSINPKQIELIKYKTIKQTWESIMSEYKKIS